MRWLLLPVAALPAAASRAASGPWPDGAGSGYTSALVLAVLVAGLLYAAIQVYALRRRAEAQASEARRARDELAAERAALQATEARLIRSREQLDLALSSAHAGTWTWDLATRGITWSDEVWRLCGLDPTPGPVTCRMWRSRIDPGDVDAVAASVDAAVAERRGFEYVWRVRAPDDGEPPPTRWLLTRGQPEFDEAGTLRGYNGIIVDISERKAAEEAQELYLRAFFDSPIGKAVAGTDDALLIEANEAFCRMLGYRRDEVIGRTAFELGLWQDRAERAEYVRKVRRDGIVRDRDVLAVVRDGTSRNLRVTSHLATFRGRECLFVSVLDCTEQKRAETALRHSEGRFRSVFANNMVPMGVWTVSGRITEANDALLALIGYSRAELDAGEVRIGRLTPVQFRRRDLQVLREVRSGGLCTPHERVFRHKDGHQVPIFIGCGSFDGTAESGVFYAIDLTARKAAEEELRRREAVLSAIVARAGDAIELTDMETFRFVEFNQASCELLGYTREEYARLTVFDIQAELSERQVRALSERIRVGEGRVFATRHRRKDGGVIDVQVSLRIIELEGRRYAVAIWSDIGEMLAIQRQLADSEQRLRLATEAARIGVWEYDHGTCRLYWSPEIHAVFGVPPGPPTLERLLSLVHEEDRHLLEEALQRAVSTRTRYHCQYRLLVDGRTIWVEDHGRIHRTADGRPERIVGLAQDITERKVAEAAQRGSEARLRTLLQTLPDLVWLKDPDGVYLACNPRFQSLYGRLEQEILGRTDIDFVDRGLADFFRAHDLAAIAAGGPMMYEEELTFASDGHRELLQTIKTPVRDDAGRLIGVLGVARDITELRRNATELEAHRQHLEQLVERRTHELAAERERLNAILEGTDAGTWEWDVQTDAATYNERWAAMLGYTVAELSPTSVDTWRRLAHPEDLLRAQQTQRAHFAGELPLYECEARLRHKQGHWVWVLARGKVSGRGEDGRPLKMSGTHLDITARKAAELALQQAKEAAEAADRAKSSFLAHMSHEIRTPLNGVLGLAQIGWRDSAEHSEARETFSRILDSGKTLLAIINDILDYSKIEAGKLAVEVVPLDPARLVGETVQGMAALASQKGLDLRAECGALPAAVLGDPVRLSQVLYNLLSNAIKFTTRGEVVLHARVDGSRLVFAVRDTGIGIAPDVLERLFRPFEQADSSSTRLFGGTGLGLAISRRLAGLMDGSLEVASTPGRGSTFTLRLPLRVAPATEPEGPRAGPCGRRLEGLRVLVAEDNAINQIVLDELLRGEGADVELVDDGQQAVDRAARAVPAFDAVLMDVQMPVMDGLEATRRLVRAHPHLPVIGQTAHALKEEAERCRAAGMVASVQKPIDLEALIALLLEQVARARRAAGAAAAPGPAPAAAPDGPQAAIAAVIDWDALHRRHPQRPDVVERLARMFIDRHAGDGARLCAAAAARDHATVARSAHELKGSAGNVCAGRVVHEAAEAQRQAQRRVDGGDGGDDAAVAAAVQRLAAALDDAIAALRLGALPPPQDAATAARPLDASARAD